MLNYLRFTFLFLLFVFSMLIQAQSHMAFLFTEKNKTYEPFLKELSERTSINMGLEATYYDHIQDESLNEPWLWVSHPEKLNQLSEEDLKKLSSWLKRGGFLVLQNVRDKESLRFTKKFLENKNESQGWSSIPLDHELMRSFFILDSLPQCGEQKWAGFSYDKRLAIISIPFNLMESASDALNTTSCKGVVSQDILAMAFVNLVLVSLTTDYKKDQIHLQKKLETLD